METSRETYQTLTDKEIKFVRQILEIDARYQRVCLTEVEPVRRIENTSSVQLLPVAIGSQPHWFHASPYASLRCADPHVFSQRSFHNLMTLEFMSISCINVMPLIDIANLEYFMA